MSWQPFEHRREVARQRFDQVQAHVRETQPHRLHQRQVEHRRGARRQADADMSGQAALLGGTHRFFGVAQRQLGLLKEGDTGVRRGDAVDVRCSKRVDNSLSRRLIYRLSADVTMLRSAAARPMLRSSQVRTK